jgi:Putative binding domain, N-terminal
VSVAVTNGPCRWTAVSSDHWITVSQTEGTTNATVRVNFDQNSGGDRTGSVTFTGSECNPQCRNGSTTVFIRQRRGVVILSLTLTQGESLSGPHAGFATGPNGFSCTLRQDPTACPPLQVPAGTSVTIVITLTDGTGDAPIFRTSGCDSRGGNSCTVMMNGDRGVTIGLGCAVCGVLEPEFEPLVETGSEEQLDVSTANNRLTRGVDDGIVVVRGREEERWLAGFRQPCVHGSVTTPRLV